MDIKQTVLELFALKDKHEWLIFKENWFQPDTLGEQVSALSNSATIHDRQYAYIIWGVNVRSHRIVGTTFNQHCEYNGEPYQNYLTRNLSPNINFSFEETKISGKRVVVLVIPAAVELPTSFKEQRFIRVGASKYNLKALPKKEIELFRKLYKRTETIETVPSKYQELTFQKLFSYFGSKGIVLSPKTFIKTLELKTADGKFNIMAQLLSDNSHIPLRVSFFDGKTKDSNLFSIREFGNDCLFYSLELLLRYGDMLNLRQTDEANKIIERKEVPLFDNKAFREAIINAVQHNDWLEGAEPMISVFSDRIEILSRGILAPAQTMEGFFMGESVPVNEKLSEIFLHLHLSERSGRGVPRIAEMYGKEAYSFRENAIVLTIPFEGIKMVSDKKPLSLRRQKIISEMKNNPNITTAELHNILGVSETAVDNNISFLRENKYIERVGSKKAGYWKVL